MKFILPSILGTYSGIMSLFAIYCFYATFTHSGFMFFVALGFTLTAITGWLATSSAISAVREW